MKYIYVLEDDLKLQKQIFEAIRKSDEQIQVRFFSTFEEFGNWIPVAVHQKKEATFQGGTRFSDDKSDPVEMQPDDTIILMVVKDEWLGTVNLQLLRKTQDLFIRKGICTAEDPTRMVLTAFESPTFAIREAEDKLVNNVIFKPFDQLILQQHLNYAISGHALPSENFVHVVQSRQEAEMNEEVNVEAIGDMGFVTRGPKEIKVGEVSKYYGEIFRSVNRLHVMGRCIACEPHPDLPGEFRAWYSYFGIPSGQISEIRQMLVKRQLPEFGATLQTPTLEPGKKWIIIDRDKDRSLKFKKLMEETLQADVEIYTSLAAFAYQSDPMAYEAARTDPALPNIPKLMVTFDSRGERPISSLPEIISDPIFGVDWVEFKGREFSSKLHPASATVWKEIVSKGFKQPEVILIQGGATYFPVKILSLTKTQNGNLQNVVAEFSEPEKPELSDWFQNKFPNPANSRGIIIGNEFISEQRKGFWQKFRSKSQAHLFASQDKAADEKQARSYPWLVDIFDSSNEPIYIKRKLSWLFSLPAEKTLAFLHECQEAIKVANPVEVAEFSEAGVVVNYDRAISLGSFRQFVMDKKAEVLVEYRANCNYSCEHPSEKGMFQNHFVFFGVTDAHLKAMRVWILENYVSDKTEGG